MSRFPRFGPYAFLVAILLVASVARGGEKYWALDAGAYMNNIVQRFQAPAGYAGDVSTLSGFFRVRRGFNLGGRFTFEPGFWLLLPWAGGSDGFAKTFTFELDLNTGFDVFSFLRIHAGPGIQYLMSVGSGEQVDLSNGTGQSPFYLPGGISNAFLLTVGAGLEVKFLRRWSLNLDLWVLNVASQARRSYQAAASIGFRL